MISSEGMVPESFPNNDPQLPIPQGIQPRPRMQALIKKFIIIENGEKLRKNLVKGMKCQRWSVQDTKIEASNLRRLEVVVKASKMATRFSLSVEDLSIMREEVKIICERLKRLSSLRTLNLYLKDTEMTDQGLYQMKKALSRLKSLQSLKIDVSWCPDISDRGLGCIFKGLKRLPLFRNLNIMATEFKKAPGGFSSMTRNLKGLVHLEKLRFNFGKWANFAEREWKDFSQILGCLTSLRTLKMRFYLCQSLNNTAVANLSKALEKLVSLENLKFDATFCNNVDDEGIKSLANSLRGLTTLSSITISFALERQNKNRITDIGLNYLKEVIKKQVSLKKFTADFSWTGVTHEGLGSLIEGLERQNSPLQKMWMLLNECDILDTGLELLSKKLKTFSSLKKIFFFFDHCKGMTGTHLKSLYECLKSLVDLQEVGFFFGWSSIPTDRIEEFKADLKRTFPLANVTIIGCGQD